MDLARRGIARHVCSVEEARPICRLWYCRVGACSFASAAQNIRKEERSNSIGLTPHLQALSLPEDPSHTVLRRELEERLERKIAGP